ncbi:MAG: hypothetical protein HY718_19585 [Planctomycetes bacterium]|nr:hypothetical protein [Planctomycetota bacterium]
MKARTNGNGGSVSASRTDRPIDLREAYSIYFRRRRLALGLVLLTLLGVAIGNYLQYPVFESRTRILVERTAGANIPFSQEQIAFRKSEITETQAQLLTCGPVLEQVVRRLELADHPVPTGSLRDRAHAVWDGLVDKVGRLKEGAKRLAVERVLGKTYKPPPEPDRFARAVEGLRTAAQAEAVPNTDVVLLTVRDRDPEMAARIANTMTAIYLDQELVHQRAKARQVYELIDAQVQAFRSTYEASQRAVEEFEGREQARLLKDRIRTQIEEASRLEVAYRELVETQKSRLLTLQLDLARMEKIYSADNPKVLAAQSELAKAQQELTGAADTQPAGGGPDDRLARANTILNRIREIRDDLAELTQREAEYSRLVEVRDRDEKLYRDLQSKREEAAIAEATRTPGPRIFEPALAPGKPSYPRKRLNLLLGLVAGLFAATAVCALLEFLDRSIKTPADVARVADGLEIWSIPDRRRPGALPRSLS